MAAFLRKTEPGVRAISDKWPYLSDRAATVFAEMLEEASVRVAAVEKADGAAAAATYAQERFKAIATLLKLCGPSSNQF